MTGRSVQKLVGHVAVSLFRDLFRAAHLEYKTSRGCSSRVLELGFPWEPGVCVFYACSSISRILGRAYNILLRSVAAICCLGIKNSGPELSPGNFNNVSTKHTIDCNPTTYFNRTTTRFVHRVKKYIIGYFRLYLSRQTGRIQGAFNKETLVFFKSI